MLYERISDWLLWIGGVLVLAVNVGLIASLMARPTVTLNAFNVTTLLLTFGGGLSAIYLSRRPTGLIVANILLLLGMIATVFGWIWLLYLGPVSLVAAGTSLKILRRLLRRPPHSLSS